MENLTKNNFTALLVILFTMQMLKLNAQELKEWQGKISLHDSTFKADSAIGKKDQSLTLDLIELDYTIGLVVVKIPCLYKV